MPQINRTEIRACLKAYEVARQQHEQILADQEIQHWFTVNNPAEAQRLIGEKYPFGPWEKVTERAHTLVRAVFRSTPHEVDPQDYWGDPSVFRDVLKLASEV